MGLTVTTLGTGSPLPDPSRAGPSTLVQAGSTRLLVDAGRGVLMRLAASGVLPVMLDAVLLTHLHSDHITDLNDVITTHWVMSLRPTPLHGYGPAPTREVVDGILAMLAPDIGYRVAHHDDLTWTPIVEVHELSRPNACRSGTRPSSSVPPIIDRSSQRSATGSSTPVPPLSSLATGCHVLGSTSCAATPMSTCRR